MIRNDGLKSEVTTRIYDTPKWAMLLAAGLIGWLVLLFGVFFVMIGMSALFNAAGVRVSLGNGLFIVEVIFAFLVSAVVCYYITGRAYKWFSRMRPAILYIILAVLSCITVLSFPAPFVFSEI